MQTTHDTLLSIVIPVYGVEAYISELMDSLFPQLTPEVECLFIDDGCLDNSITLVKERLAILPENVNIKIISQKNQGVSAARNTGLEAAVGQYITFLDPDDYVLENYINLILSIIKSHSVDIIHFNALKNDCFNNISQLKLVEKEQLIQNNEQFLQKLLKKNYWYPWLRVVHKNSLNDFNFPVGYILEDMLAIPHLYKKANSIYEISENLVFYRYREGSLINNNNFTP